jgi:hypothetical protein
MRFHVLRELHQMATPGILLMQKFDGDPFTPYCDTLEDPVREQLQDDGKWLWRPEFKIPGETAIPSGLYDLTVNFSPHFNKNMIEVLNVPDFSGIRWHGGNTTADTEGCLLVGLKQINFHIAGGIRINGELIDLVSAALESGASVSVFYENGR